MSQAYEVGGWFHKDVKEKKSGDIQWREVCWILKKDNDTKKLYRHGNDGGGKVAFYD